MHDVFVNAFFFMFDRNYLNIFEKYDEGTGILHKDGLRKALHALDLYPSKSQGKGILDLYTLSHPKNDCDFTERAKGYTL